MAMNSVMKINNYTINGIIAISTVLVAYLYFVGSHLNLFYVSMGSGVLVFLLSSLAKIHEERKVEREAYQITERAGVDYNINDFFEEFNKEIEREEVKPTPTNASVETIKVKKEENSVFKKEDDIDLFDKFDI